jgi:hypothetical protein
MSLLPYRRRKMVKRTVRERRRVARQTQTRLLVVDRTARTRTVPRRGQGAVRLWGPQQGAQAKRRRRKRKGVIIHLVLGTRGVPRRLIPVVRIILFVWLSFHHGHCCALTRQIREFSTFGTSIALR